ncbi:MAG: energy-coupling factor transporter transmembrane component T family protein [Candidatus Bathyarchaeia archaeon]|jgi:energy-coupling factor transport system permease protein
MLPTNSDTNYNKKSLMGSIHPIIKMICAILIFITCIAVTKAIPLAIYLGTMLVVLVISRMARITGRMLLFFTPVALLVCLVSWLGGNTLSSSFVSTMRILFIGISLIMFAYTTTPAEFIRSLETLKVPRQITLGFMVALRFIPVFMEEVEKIRQSLRIRGTKVKRGLRFYYRGFFVPLLYRIYTLSDGITLGLHTRGFCLNGNRTVLHELRFRPWDALFLTFFLIASIVVILL